MTARSQIALTYAVLLGLAVALAVFVAIAGLLSAAALPLFWPDEEPGAVWIAGVGLSAGIAALYAGLHLGRDYYNRRLG